jgi:hypothetical protein
VPLFVIFLFGIHAEKVYWNGIKNDFFHVLLGVVERIHSIQCDKNGLFMLHSGFFFGCTKLLISMY